MFEALWQRLTLAQRAVLRAVVLEEGRELLSADTRTRHRLGGPSTVQAALTALQAAGVLGVSPRQMRRLRHRLEVFGEVRHFHEQAVEKHGLRVSYTASPAMSWGPCSRR